MTRLCLRGGLVVAEGFTGVADIGIDEHGRISAIGEGAGEGASTVIDVGGATVIPGAVDAHTHFRSPGYAEREDAVSGSLAALHGGVTTFIEMPMADVGTSTAERVRERSKLFAAQSVVDFGLFGGGGFGALDEIGAMAAAGVLGFKSFLRPPYPGRARSFEGTDVENEAQLAQVVAAIAETGLPWLIHAENVFLKGLVRAGAADGLYRGLQDRTADAVLAETWAETSGVQLALSYARAAGVPLHVVHATTAETLRLVADASIDVDVTPEVALPHLAFVAGDEERFGPLARVSPAAKSVADRDALWAAVASGQMCNIASDHAGYSPEEYEDLLAGRLTGPLGIPSVEHLVTLTLTMARERGIALPAVVAALTSRPARRFGLWPRKGSISIGADADLVVLDDTTSQPIRQAEMVAKGKHSPFDGWELSYRVQGVVTRGRLALWDGQTSAEPGWGARLLPAAVPASGDRH